MLKISKERGLHLEAAALGAVQALAVRSNGSYELARTVNVLGNIYLFACEEVVGWRDVDSEG